MPGSSLFLRDINEGTKDLIDLVFNSKSSFKIKVNLRLQVVLTIKSRLSPCLSCSSGPTQISADSIAQAGFMLKVQNLDKTTWLYVKA